MLSPVILAILVVPFACLCLPCFLRIVVRFRANESQRRGASRAAINALPTVKYKPSMFGEEEEVCPICLGEYAEDETLRVLQCSGAHHFHIACVVNDLFHAQTAGGGMVMASSIRQEGRLCRSTALLLAHPFLPQLHRPVAGAQLHLPLL